LSEARSQKGSLTTIRSKKPEGPADACQNPEEDKLQRWVFFLLLASCFWLLASGFWLLASVFCLLASGFWLLASGFWLLASGF
jgi:fatty acid desaturase